MTIATLEDYAGAPKQRVMFVKASSVGIGAGVFASVSSAGGGVPAAISNPSNITTGTVPVAGDTGFPSLQSWSGSGYITNIEYTYSAEVLRGFVYDRLFQAGNFSAVAGTTTLGSQPSYSGRVPSGTDYKGTQIWLEGRNVSGSPSITVTYTDQSGNAGHSTGTYTGTGLSGASLIQMSLASGDTGVSKIESVVVTGAATGTFNVVVVRPLFWMFPPAVNVTRGHPLEEIGAPIVFGTSALAIATFTGIGASPAIEMSIEIASN